MGNGKAIGAPWCAEVCKDRGPIVVDQSGGLVGICNTWSFMDSRDQAKARHERNVENTRRIVACVNACEGVPTAVLESVKSLDNSAFVSEVAKQRDQLLAALEAIAADDYEAPHHANDADLSREKGRLICRIKEAARSAIAAAKAGAA